MKTVWITGASSGLGLAAAEAFRAAGWRVIAGARRFEEELQDGFVHLPLDVTDAHSCERFAARALEISPDVDALVCGAAILVLGSCEKTSAEEYRRVMETNFVGAARMVQLALPVMRSQKQGRIFLFSSINGLLGIPFQSAYTASKHAMEGYAECLAMETKSFGIQICLIEPGDHRSGSQHTRLHATGENADSPYADAYDSAVQVIRRDEADGLAPERLARRIVAQAARRHMRFRLRVAKPDQHLAVWLHKCLPARINHWILRGYYMK